MIKEIVYRRADPWVYRHTDGYYYFTGSVPGYQEIEVRRSKKIENLENAERVSVWHAPATGDMSKLIWAPEIHYIKNKWYIYFAASNSEGPRNEKNHHRMFVIECDEISPMTTNWQVKGEIVTNQNSFSLDATVLELNHQLYYIWAQLEPALDVNSNLYISKMSNPWTLTGKQTMIAVPQLPWEKIGFSVNEGPAAIVHSEKVFITFSASATDENYAVGLLWADQSADLLDGYSWHKLSQPVFTSSKGNGLFGPGHNSFTKDTNNQDVIIYHARPYDNAGIQGDPLDNPDRHAYAQTFDWDKDGFPLFGKPGDNSHIIEGSQN